MRLKLCNVFLMVEPVCYLLVLRAIPVIEGKQVVSACWEKLVICWIGTSPYLFDNVICKFTLQECHHIESGDKI